ncbi:MAG: SURF1 family protein [Hyphomicrobiales bacterium]|nr:SURF1 family protein [Hyphomicrobiales bacterium]
MSLGFWQVQRLQWKQDLISRVASQMEAEPMPAPGPEAWPTLDVTAEEYRPVMVPGRFFNDREAHVVFTLTQPKGPIGGIGYMVMTPLQTDEGWIVYINRGFVPRDRRDRQDRAGGLPQTPTTVEGLLRRPHQRVWFGPADDPDGNEWFSRDPAAFAASAGLSSKTVAPYIVDAFADPELPGGLPQGGETVVTFSNNHLQYAVTWFGLALALLGVFAAVVLKARR